MPTSPVSSEQVISGVSNALRGFICAYVPRLESEESITFDAPDALDGTNENRLSLYLYQIELNPELRNAPAMLSAEQGFPTVSATLALTPAPLAVDLFYMLVVFGQSYEYEQMLAGSVVNLLDRCGRIPDDFISQSLRDSGNSNLNVVPQPATNHMLRDLWAWFPNKAYHLTKLYSISPVRLPAPASTPVDVVLEVNPVHTTVTNPKAEAQQ